MNVIKEDIFSTINTKEKAYWLGFLYADGYIRGDMIRLVLGEKDLKQVRRFITFIGGNVNSIKKYGPYKTSGIQIHYYFSNSNISRDLRNLGILECKSKTIRLPNIPNDFYKPFILGYFDGDGCQGTSCICSGSKRFLEDIKTHFQLKRNVYNTKSNQSTYYLSLGASLFNEILDSHEESMKRKRIYLRSKKKNFKQPKINNRQTINVICPKCGNKKDKRASQCISCYNVEKYNKRKFILTKSELNVLLNEDNMSFVAIGKIYNVSDNTVRKRAHQYGLL